MALRVLTIPLVLAVLVLTVFPRIAEGKAGSSDDYYEVPPVLRASDVLPAKSLRGPDHRVQEAVYNDGFYNRYNVQTTFGRFTVEGTDLLMIRLSEIDAIRRMEDLKSAQVYGDAVKEAATGPLRLANTGWGACRSSRTTSPPESTRAIAAS